MVLLIIEKDIFGAGQQVGVVPDPCAQGGGGHISLDEQTTQGGSAEVRLSTLGYLHNNNNAWQDFFKEPDALYAPWQEEMTRTGKNALEKFNQKKGELNGQFWEGHLDFVMVVKELKDFNKSLKIPCAEKQKSEKEKKVQGENVAANHSTTRLSTSSTLLSATNERASRGDASPRRHGKIICLSTSSTYLRCTPQCASGC